MKIGFSPFHVNRKGYHLTLESVPAWVCLQCGESFFEEHEVDSLQEIIQTLTERTRKLAIAA